MQTCPNTYVREARIGALESPGIGEFRGFGCAGMRSGRRDYALAGLLLCLNRPELTATRETTATKVARSGDREPDAGFCRPEAEAAARKAFGSAMGRAVSSIGGRERKKLVGALDGLADASRSLADSYRES